MALNQYISPTSSLHVSSSNTYTEEFKAFLQQIQAEYSTTLRQIPLDEPRIQVNLNTRIIDIENSEYADFLAMAEDHRATTIYFEVARYFEDVDLFNCTCIVEYINGGGHPRVYPVTLKDIIKGQDDNGRIIDKMVLAWNIGSEATLFAGDIKFCITFYKIAYDETERRCDMIYALHTTEATGYIMPGMDYTEEQDKELSDIYTMQAEYYNSLIAMINQKNVYWNDL